MLAELFIFVLTWKIHRCARILVIGYVHDISLVSHSLNQFRVALQILREFVGDCAIARLQNHFAISPAIFGSGPASNSVAGQASRKAVAV